MYHFNENNIVAGYIKELLHNFELPVCPVYVSGRTKIYPSTNYIYNRSIILTNALPNGSTSNSYSVLEGNYKPVQPYFYGQAIPNLTKRLKLNSILYDTYTHEYLGDYLRFYRDFVGIDLMPLYNCFSNRKVTTLDYGKRFDASDVRYKIYSVPVKFGASYLIGIDSDLDVEMVCGLAEDALQVTQLDTSSLYTESYKKYSSLQFNHPTVYSTDFASAATFHDMESCLRLYIKLPASNKSSISIVETFAPDYYFEQMVDGRVAGIACNFETADMPEAAKELSKDLATSMNFPSKLSLFKVNDGVSYPFADRLLEYLFGQAIAADDMIGSNIERIRQQLLSSLQYTKNGVQLGLLTPMGDAGVWSPYIRLLCYLAANHPHTSEQTTFTQQVYDLMYYVDKDMESLVTVGEESL